MNRDNNIIKSRRQQPVIAATKKPNNNNSKQPLTMTTQTKASSSSSSLQTNAGQSSQLRPTTTTTTTTTMGASFKAKGSLSSANNVQTATAGKKVTGRQAMAAITTTTTTTTGQPLMKKAAHVRFDDYLDLNEENMRRSCKRLMNHLYSESSPSSSTSPPSASIVGGGARQTNAIKKTQANEALMLKQPATGAPTIKTSMANNAIDINMSCKTAPSTVQQQQQHQQPQKQQTIATSVPTNQVGKSYLRSQYERRQQRQLELMSKIQLEPANKNNNSNNNSDGANECRLKQQQQHQNQEMFKHKQQNEDQQQQQQQQQDLVAKSHELSKRRFFEKLERRESIRNLNLSTPTQAISASIGSIGAGKTLKVAAAPDATKTFGPPAKISPKSMEKAGGDKAKSEQAPPKEEANIETTDNDRQNGLGGDDELMLKVYQSIVLKGSINLTMANAKTANTTTILNNCDGFNNDTLGGLAGTQDVEKLANPSSSSKSCSIIENTKELANEPIGYHTRSQVKADCQNEHELLIEFSSGKQLQKQQQLRQLDGEHQLIQLDESPELDLGNRCFEAHSSAFSTAEVANHSAFEIRVPESLNSSQNQSSGVDGFISSGLLIVKQVDDAAASVDSYLLPTALHQNNDNNINNNNNNNSIRRPPTLSGRNHHNKSTNELVIVEANKIETPDESADDNNKTTAQQIDGLSSSGSANKINATSTSSRSSSATMTDSDQEQNLLARVGQSITISSENNNNNNNNNNELMNKAIRPAKIEARKTTTTSNGIDHGGGSGGGNSEREEFRASSSSDGLYYSAEAVAANCQRKANGVCSGSGGESNCVKDHEAPEMRMLVGQSGGAAGKSGSTTRTTATNLGDLVVVAAVEQPDDDDEGRKESSTVAAYSLLQPQIRSTAQERAQQVASLQTTITTEQPEIRDVLPIAIEINRTKDSAIAVSHNESDALTSNNDVRGPGGQVSSWSVKSAKQVNEIYSSSSSAGKLLQKERLNLEKDFLRRDSQYANSSSFHPPDEKEEEEEQQQQRMNENNVNHDPKSNGGTSRDSCNVSMGEHLIESFAQTETAKQHHTSLTQKNSNLSAEEDGGSSCSSSGFGASVSVTSSSEGSSSLADAHLLVNVVSGPNEKRESGAANRRPNSLSIVQVASSRISDHHLYDSVRPARAWAGLYQQQQQQLNDEIVHNSESTNNTANEFPDYKQLVGPDQAYPLKSGSRSLLLVENHNYASILSRCDMMRMSGKNDDSKEGIVLLEQDEPFEGYANLPPMIRSNSSSSSSGGGNNGINHANKPNVEYATVRSQQPSYNGNGSNVSGGYCTNSSNDNMDISQSKTKRFNDSASDVATDLSSGHSYSTSNSGGFSALPPAKLECIPAANNLEPDLDNSSSPKKSSSILRRFGSLVSRAFTGGQQQTNHQHVQSQVSTSISTPKINEISSASPSDLPAEESQVSGENGIEQKRKSALVIEQKQPDLLEANKEQQPIKEADLVILPPKHVNQQQQRKQPIADGQQKQNIEETRRHEDRLLLSRGNRHSRKFKRIDSTTSLSTPTSSTSASESRSSSSLSASSTNIRLRTNNHHQQQHPRRAESLFEDLESLVGPAERNSNAAAYGRLGSLRRSRRRSSGRPSKQPLRATTEGQCIEIDCISPDGKKTESKALEQARRGGANKTSGGPRSLLRLFNAISQSSQSRSSESTPNLAAPMPQSSCSDYASNCEQETQGDSLQPMSGFWGLSSLMMGSSHAKTVEITAPSELSTKASRQKDGRQTRASAKHRQQNDATDEAEYGAESLYSTNLQTSTSLHHHVSSSSRKHHLQQQQLEHHSIDSNNKYQSLNLYQNLLRNYAKRRNRDHSSHSHHHHHSHNHHSSNSNNHYGGHHNHHHHHRSNRIHSCRSTRCSVQHCQLSSSGSEISSANRAVVWGQLIKINKADGSQVIELQRLPGKSWGFFVARGAINDIKGIFISRMHDSVTSNSLAGLLSIGDRILAIDECPIEPDYDILRVNQMMSKKSRILLKVKPFKG